MSGISMRSKFSGLLRPEEKQNQYLRVFLLAMGTAIVLFLPSVIYYGGHFFFSGDFNVQQVPFYQYCWRQVHEGNIFWLWTTDLGTDFISSYSFYIVGSPFFWFALLLPYSWIPYMMAPLLVLKISFAALTSYTYFKRFIENQNFAVIAGLLYAFSGWSIYNIFFNHFHEPMVFFPLMLVGLEKLVLEGKKGRFAAAVAINAIISYFFFAGQVVFVILYFFVRFWDKNWRMTIQRFLAVAFEALFGTLAAAVILCPSVLAVLNNPRTVDPATGYSLLFYDRVQRYAYIIQSMFFPPELPARLNFFTEAGSRWSSVAAWLPFTGMIGVIAFISSYRKHWIKRLLIICFVMSMVPVLNSLFFMLNSSYYARWFYMAILIMCLATGKALSEGTADIGRGVKWTLAVTCLFIAAIGFLPEYNSEGTLELGLYESSERFWGDSIIALYSVLMFLLIWKSYGKDKPRYTRLLTVGVVCTSMITGIFFLLSGTTSREEATFISTTAQSSAEEMNLDTSYFWRMDVDGDTMDNQGFFWDIPNIQCFQSTVNSAIMEFYPSVGVSRDVASRPEQTDFPLRGLLSVKYLFIAESDVNKEMDPVTCTMPGFTYYDTQNQFCIYENEYFVPMGFTYDSCITREQYEELSYSQRQRVLLKAIVLEDQETVDRFSDILTQEESPDYLTYTSDAYLADCSERASRCCYSFETDTNGFTAHINLDSEELVFFSVPYEEGSWTATVNGAPAEIIKVNIGFMAVVAPAGECEIRLNYETPGLKLGAVVSVCSVAILIVYCLVNFILRRKQKLAPAPETEEATKITEEAESDIASESPGNGSDEPVSQEVSSTVDRE